MNSVGCAVRPTTGLKINAALQVKGPMGVLSENRQSLAR